MEHPLIAWRRRHATAGNPFSQSRLGALAGTSGVTVHRVETAKTPGRIGTLRALSDATREVDPADWVQVDVLAAWATKAQTPPKPAKATEDHLTPAVA